MREKESRWNEKGRRLVCYMRERKKVRCGWYEKERREKQFYKERRGGEREREREICVVGWKFPTA